MGPSCLTSATARSGSGEKADTRQQRAAWPGTDSTNRRINIGVTSPRACHRKDLRPIDVSVPYKRGQEWLRTVGRPSILGEGLLERARAISLALLGVTAAVGLAIIALAMNQGWPLVAGSSIPGISPQHQAVGKATVAAEMRSIQAGQVSFVDRLPSAAQAGRSEPQRQASGLAGGPPTDSTELVVAPSSPVKPDGDRSQGSPKPEPTPVVQQPQPASQAAPAPAASEPAALPVSQSPAEAAPPSPTTSEAPVSDPDPDSDPDVPSWSHGNGHGYGHDDWADDEDDWSDSDSHDWDDHGHGSWHGHRYGD
jgi:hypothetical protein